MKAADTQYSGTDPGAKQPGSLPVAIGPYRIVGKLGEGGMGVVYDAIQEEPIRRPVAVKVIKLGMDTARVVVRFEAERQALAVMDHPAIAKVFDAGATDFGRPYFVMERVHGAPITEYCDRHGLPTSARLRLFLSICGAVQHAHQKGVIHRDLKPSNILVKGSNGDATPKVIDFGVAKAVAQSLTAETLETEVGCQVGTPAYMSPEQAGATGLDIDTRTDIYSLGVVLYQLLAGSLPIDPGEVGVASFMEQLKAGRSDPPKPSRKFKSLGHESDQVAQVRLTDPKSLYRELDGDLDWIVMKAMEADRERRYHSASAFADDIGRSLRHQPILARPASVAYRMRKFARRHRVGVTAGAAILAAILAGASAATAGMLSAVRAEAHATEEAAAASQVTQFLEDLFQGADPFVPGNESQTVESLLDRGARRVEAELGDQPLVAARLRAVIGRSYFGLGKYDDARGQQEEALRLRVGTLGPDHLDVAASLMELGSVAYRQGRYADAESLQRQALAIRARHLPENDPILAETAEWLATSLARLGTPDEVEVLRKRVLSIREAAFGPHHIDVSKALNALGVYYLSAGRFTDAQSVLHRALVIRDSILGPEDATMIKVVDNLGGTMLELGRYETADSLFRVVHRIRLRALGPDHPTHARTLDLLGHVQLKRGRLAEAESLFAASIDIRERHFGADNPRFSASYWGLGLVYHAQDRLDEAERLLRRALAIKRARLSVDHEETSGVLTDLGALLAERGQPIEAEACLREAIGMRERQLGAAHPEYARTLVHLATLTRDRGDRAAADSMYATALRIWEATLGPAHPDVAWLRTEATAPQSR